MTYQEALQSGYTNNDRTLQRGYVSRRINTDNQQVLTAGGKRAGDLYVMLPSWDSTQYCVRQYLVKGDQ